MTSTDSGVEALLLPGVGSTTCGSLTAMALLKVKAWVLGSVQWSVQTSSTATAVLTGRLVDVGLSGLGVAVQPSGATALAVMLTLTGPAGPLLCRVFRSVTGTFSDTSISAGAPRIDWPSILTSALPITFSESCVEALLLPSAGSTTCGVDDGDGVVEA